MLGKNYNPSILGIVLCCCLTWFDTPVRAQSYYVENERTFFGGLVAGANFSQIDGDNYKGFDKVGVNVGGIVYTRVSSDIAASIEILFTQRGAYGKEASDLGEKGIFVSNYRATLAYAEVPVMLHYFFPDKNHFGAGLSYARLVKSTENATTYPIQNFDQTKYPFRKHALDFILDGKIRVWKGLYVNPRFQYSIIPLRGEGEMPKYFGREQYNRVVSLRLVYLFGLKYNKKSN